MLLRHTPTLDYPAIVQHYWIALNPALGRLAIYRYDGAWTALQNWTSQGAIATGSATNRLRVRCQGAQLAVYVNGALVAMVSDAAFSSGYVGLCASGAGMEARFDQVLDPGSYASTLLE